MALAGLAATGVAQAQFQDRTIRVSNGVNQDHPVGNGVAKMTECLAQKSGGKMKLQAFWGGALGGDLQATQALRSGTQEAVVTSTSPLVGISKELGVFDLPFLFANEKEADAILDGPFGKHISDKMPQYGLVNLAYWENGFRNLTNSKKPVTKWEDIGGLKVRVMQNNIFLDTFKTMGANAVPMAFGEVFTALETKAIDGQENPFVTIDTSKFYEVQKYVSATQARVHAVHGAVLEEDLRQLLAAGAEGARRLRDRRPRRAAQGVARAQQQVARQPEGEGHGGERDLARRTGADAGSGEAGVREERDGDRRRHRQADAGRAREAAQVAT